MKSNAIINIKPLGFPWETSDPFLFCAYHRDEYPRGNPQMGPDASLAGRAIGQDFVIKDGWRMYHGTAIPGFPYHPHRGFETITINKEGIVDHSDSLGAAGRFGKGDVQWMTAGKGVLHSEMFPLLHQDKENTLEIFQVWLNLPKASKFVEPSFKMLWSDAIPIIREKDNEGLITEINLIAGTLNGDSAPAPTPDSWAANSNNHVMVLTISMEPRARWTLPPAAAEANRSLYFYRGDSLEVDEETTIEENSMVRLKADKSVVLQNGTSKGYILLLQGKPINEPVAQHGPFVMNTMEEIQQAFKDYQSTQFGGWPWPNQEQVHDKHRGRFALHADGKEEIK